jgi:hypothetical protein
LDGLYLVVGRGFRKVEGMSIGRLKRVLTLLLVLGCLLVAGCGSEAASTTTTVTLPAGWSLFEGGHVSVALPDSFKGGDPRDAEVAAIVDQAMAASGSTVDASSYDLVAVGEPNSYGAFATVVAVYASGLDMDGYTTQQGIDYFVEGLRASGRYELEVTTVSMTENRAVLKCSYSVAGGSAGIVQAYSVLLAGDSWTCLVQYALDDISNTSLWQAFETSAETIVIRED